MKEKPLKSLTKEDLDKMKKVKIPEISDEEYQKITLTKEAVKILNFLENKEENIEEKTDKSVENLDNKIPQRSENDQKFIKNYVNHGMKTYLATKKTNRDK